MSIPELLRFYFSVGTIYRVHHLITVFRVLWYVLGRESSIQQHDSSRQGDADDEPLGADQQGDAGHVDRVHDGAALPDGHDALQDESMGGVPSRPRDAQRGYSYDACGRLASVHSSIDMEILSN